MLEWMYLIKRMGDREMEKVIIWGAGNTGKQAYAWCENKYEVFAFADNDKQKIGGGYIWIVMLFPPNRYWIINT